MEHPLLIIAAIIVSNLILIYAYRFMIISIGHKQNLKWYLFWGYFSAFNIIPKYIKLLHDSYREKLFKKHLLCLILFLIGLLSLVIEVYFFVFR
jgi:hypothetical protein